MDLTSSSKGTSFCSSDGSRSSWLCCCYRYWNCSLVVWTVLSVHFWIDQYVPCHLLDIDDCTLACARPRCTSRSSRSNDAWWGECGRVCSSRNRLVSNVWIDCRFHHNMASFHHLLDDSSLFLSSMASIVDKPGPTFRSRNIDDFELK